MGNNLAKIVKAAAAGLLLLPTIILAQSSDPAFNPNQIIPDAVFSDTQTFGGPDGIQKFLQDKHSVLADTSPDFLQKLKEPNITMLKQAVDDPEPNLPNLRTAAQLIWDASVQSGLNPQVILVTMEKEEGLIDGQFSSPDAEQTAIDHAMGFNCGDNVGCWNLFPGFYYQLFGNLDSGGNRYLGAAKSLMKSFATGGGRGPGGAKTGDTITLDNSMGAYDNITPQQAVTLANNATAALYRYTPHVFNGNYNFWKYFTAWFKYPNGTLLKLASLNDVYIIQNGLKALVPQFVAQQRNLNLANTITVSPTEFGEYDTDKPLGPSDNTVVTVAGQAGKFVFLDSTRHPASDLVIKQRGLSAGNILTISSDDAAMFGIGSVLPPKDGTIIRGLTQPAVYLVQNESLKLFSAYTFAQNKIKTKDIVSVPDSEIVTYVQSGFVPPKDGSVFKTSASPTVYLMQSGLARPLTSEVMKSRRITNKDIATLATDEVGSLPFTSFATPAEMSFFSVSDTAQLFEFKDGSKHPISAFVAKQRGVTPDFTVTANVAAAWTDSVPIPPRDGTLVKGDQTADVYLVKNFQLNALTAAQFKAKHYSFKNVKTLPQAEVDSYAKAGAVTQ